MNLVYSANSLVTIGLLVVAYYCPNYSAAALIAIVLTSIRLSIRLFDIEDNFSTLEPICWLSLVVFNSMFNIMIMLTLMTHFKHRKTRTIITIFIGLLAFYSLFRTGRDYLKDDEYTLMSYSKQVLYGLCVIYYFIYKQQVFGKEIYQEMEEKMKSQHDMRAIVQNLEEPLLTVVGQRIEFANSKFNEMFYDFIRDVDRGTSADSLDREFSFNEYKRRTSSSCISKIRKLVRGDSQDLAETDE